MLKKFGNCSERFLAVKVVGINYYKGLMNNIARAQHGMSRAPRFDAFRIFVFAWDELVERLNNKVNFHLSLQLWKEFFFYCFQDFFPDNEYDFGKSCA